MVGRRTDAETTIGMHGIKQRRRSLTLNSYPHLRVGECVPFYFFPRSTMLYEIHLANHSELSYRGGQVPIVHLEADLRETTAWAEHHGQRWAFTDSNAGSSYFNDWSDLEELGNIDWSAVQARYWQDCKERKQAEFLIEQRFSWNLVQRVGVFSRQVQDHVARSLLASTHRPPVQVRTDWYY